MVAAWTDQDTVKNRMRIRGLNQFAANDAGVPEESGLLLPGPGAPYQGPPVIYDKGWPPDTTVQQDTGTAAGGTAGTTSQGSPYDWSVNAPTINLNVPSVGKTPAAGVDPFAALGGGTYTASGAWLPPGTDASLIAAQGGVGTPPSPGASDTLFRNQINQMVLKILGQNQNPTIQDPELAALASQNRQTLDRANALRQRQVAEQLGQSGLATSGAMQSAAERGAADVGTSQAGYEANLVNQEKQRRMAEIQSALTLGAGMMSDADKNALTAELAQLQASTQSQIALANIANQQWTEKLRNQQFLEQLGFNQADREAYYNYLAMNGLM